MNVKPSCLKTGKSTALPDYTFDEGERQPRPAQKRVKVRLFITLCCDLRLQNNLNTYFHPRRRENPTILLQTRRTRSRSDGWSSSTPPHCALIVASSAFQVTQFIRISIVNTPQVSGKRSASTAVNAHGARERCLSLRAQHQGSRRSEVTSTTFWRKRRGGNRSSRRCTVTANSSKLINTFSLSHCAFCSACASLTLAR